MNKQGGARPNAGRKKVKDGKMLQIKVPKPLHQKVKDLIKQFLKSQ